MTTINSFIETRFFDPFLDQYNRVKNKNYYLEDPSLDFYDSLDVNLNSFSKKVNSLQLVSFKDGNRKIKELTESIQSLVNPSEVYIPLHLLTTDIRSMLLSKKSNTTEVFADLTTIFDQSFIDKASTKIESFLDIDFNDLRSIKLGFLGRKVHQLALFIYGQYIFSNWTSKDEFKQMKFCSFCSFFKYAFLDETSFFVYQVLKFFINKEQFSFVQTELKEAMNLFFSSNKALFEISRALNTNYNPTIQFIYQKHNLIHLSRFCMSVFNPEVWQELKPREQFCFVKSIVSVTRELGTFGFLKALLESVTPVKDNNGLVVGFKFASSAGINLKQTILFNNVFKSCCNKDFSIPVQSS